MSITRTTFWLAAVTLLGLASNVQAQLHHPFIEPDRFDPDYQFFAPVDIDDYGGGVNPNSGWFASYARAYMYMTRPNRLEEITDTIQNPLVENFNIPDNNELADEQAGDFTWGNRFDIGYMTEDDHGWLFSAWHIDGPNENNQLIVERINRLNEDAPPVEDPPFFPTRDENSLITGGRDYILDQSINVADFSSFELNKTFRQDRLHSGGWLEPFFGFRYNKFIDFWHRETYDRFDILGNRLPPLGLPVDPELGVVEQLTTARSGATNHMVGGQLGMRYFQQQDKWLLSSEFRAFAFQNFQSMETTVDAERTVYDNVDLGEEVVTVFFQRDNAAANDAEFVYGTEIRAEAAYQVTRAVYLHMGANFMHFPQGIARGPYFNQNEQDLTMVGITFGAELNR